MIRTSIGIYGLPFLVASGISHLAKKNQWDINNLDSLHTVLSSSTQSDLIVATVEGDLDPELKAYITKFKVNVLIILSDHEAVDIKHLVSLGIKAIVNWDCPEEEVLTALRMAIKGKKYICDRLLDEMLLPHPKTTDSSVSQLSDREMEILLQIGNGYTVNQIAKNLHLSTHTVNSHRKNIMKKLNLQHPPELITYTWQTGLLKAD